MFIMSQGGVVFFHGGTTLKCLFQRGAYIFIHVLSGAYTSITISLTEHGVYNAENKSFKTGETTAKRNFRPINI